MTVRNPMTKEQYEAELFNFMKVREGAVARIYSDPDGVPTLGVGYALATKSGNTYGLRSRSSIEQAITNARGTAYTFTDEQWTLLEEVVGLLNEGKVDQAKAKIPEAIGSDTTGVYDASEDHFNLNLDTNARQNLFKTVMAEFEDDLSTTNLPYSKERIAIMSLHYNIGAMPTTFGYIRNDNLVDQRVMVWNEIRYRSNAGRDSNLEDRRKIEADTFGLYSSTDGKTPVNDNEAKEVIRYLESKRTDIESYLSDVGGTIANLNTALQPAKTLLITNYAQDVTIDGDIIVGQGIGTIPENYAD
ncbi:MAG: hypothetical protein CO011_08480, partial [Sulfurimonas sp. CG_4_8_14_3_um_filter_36_16]